MVGKICEKGRAWAASERESELWMVSVVSWESKKMWQEHQQGSQRQRDWNDGGETWRGWRNLRSLPSRQISPHRCNVSPLRGERLKIGFWLLSNLNTRRFVLLALLPVTTELTELVKSAKPRPTLLGYWHCRSTFLTDWWPTMFACVSQDPSFSVVNVGSCVAG